MYADIKHLLPSDIALKRKLCGIMNASPGKYEIIDNGYYHTLYVKNLEPDRVRLIISGGGGFGLMFPFFADNQLVDASCEGEYDSAPNAYALYEVAKLLDSEKGVLFLTNNYAGDFLNNDMAVELLQNEGIAAIACYACDDIFSAVGKDRKERGGLIGGAVLSKIAAMAAEMKLPLQEVYEITEAANQRLSSGSIVIDWKSGSCKLGAGFSGEDPIIEMPFSDWDTVIGALLEKLLEDLAPSDDETLHLTLSRMSGTSYMESYGMTYTAESLLSDMGYQIGGRVCAQYFDEFDESGAIINLYACSSAMKKYYRYVKARDFVI